MLRDAGLEGVGGLLRDMADADTELPKLRALPFFAELWRDYEAQVAPHLSTLRRTSAPSPHTHACELLPASPPHP